MESLQLYNTLTRKKEHFTPLRGKTVGLYTCGPTVYNYAHIGNLRTYIFEDILRRTLEYNDYKVKQVMNITDVGHLTSDADEGEDKLEKGAQREGKTVWDIADFYTKAFQQDLHHLNIHEPSMWCKATDYTEQQIDFILALEKKGLTYTTSDGIYFDTLQYPDYAGLAKLNLAGQAAGARVEENKEKRNPTDFALWKFSPKGKKRQMEWDSPWGMGFPGWHLECSAMSIAKLGDEFDIHCGGIDHIPIHHTNERAQNWGKTNKETVKCWMHGEFLVIDQARMGKSEGNFITLKTLIDKGYDPLAYRYFALQTHYRQKLNFSWEALDAAQNGFHNLRDIFSEIDATNGTDGSVYEENFLAAMNDDLNTPRALAVAWELLKDGSVSGKTKKKLILKFDEVFGLELVTVKKLRIPADVTMRAKKRELARQQKDFAAADALRIEIDSLGYVVDDTADGFTVKPKRR